MTARARHGFTLALNKPPWLCPVKYCRRKNCKPRDLCSRHKMQAWRAKNPIPARMTHTRESAKKRGILFALNLPDFEKFCVESALLEQGLSIDRVDAKKGYEPGNLQALPFADNSRKGGHERWGTWKGRFE